MSGDELQVDDAGSERERDAATIVRIAAGDTAALRELYDRYGRMTYAIAYRVLDDPQLSEECVQDAFVRVWRNAGRFDPTRGRPSTWLCTIARNLAIDAARARGRRPEPRADLEERGDLEKRGGPDELADDVVRADQALKVAEAMATLPAAQLEVIQLAHFEGLSQSEIAAQLKLPLGTVKSRLRLALDRLRLTVEQPDEATA